MPPFTVMEMLPVLLPKQSMPATEPILRSGAEQPWANFGNRVISNEILRTVPFSGAQYGGNWRWGGGWSNLLAGINVIPMDLG